MDEVTKDMDQLNAAVSRSQGGAARGQSKDDANDPKAGESLEQNWEDGGKLKNKFHDV
jgi:hypothetical protein